MASMHANELGIATERSGNTLYERVAETVEGLIRGGTLLPGARIPSVRKLSRQMSVSVSTVLEAYRLLEDRRLIEARPQSGYYVRQLRTPAPAPAKTASDEESVTLDTADMRLRIAEESNRRDLVPFGAAIPSAAFLPTARLNRIMAKVIREDPTASQSYDALEGNLDLRVQIARRSLEAGCSLRPDEIITTSGATEAMSLALRAVTKPGDTVAIETPTYYGLLHTLESLHLRSLEIGTDPEAGICLDELANAISKKKLKALVVVANFGNPLGHCMDDTNKAELVRMCAEANIPIIEDDIYSELVFEGERPRALSSFDDDGNVILVSSFSKTLAPGYRVGWIVPGRHINRVRHHKFASSIATATPTQMAAASYLSSGGFDRFLRGLRRSYRDLVLRTACVVTESFPEGTHVSRPRGGHILWVQMDERIDSFQLHRDALEHGIGIAPGPLFSARNRYKNCIRLNCGVPWSDQVEAALNTLGHLVTAQG